jgi:hypothetical protein
MSYGCSTLSDGLVRSYGVKLGRCGVADILLILPS